MKSTKETDQRRNPISEGRICDEESDQRMKQMRAGIRSMKEGYEKRNQVSERRYESNAQISE